MTTRTRKTTLLMIACSSMLGIAKWAFADDLNPPPWTRSGAANRSTSAEWDFTGSPTAGLPNPLLPDGNTVPLIKGDFAAALDAAFPAGAPHPSGFANSSLTFTGTGFINNDEVTHPISFNVPNWIDQEPFKFLRLQVTYTGPAPLTEVFGFLGVPGDSALVTEAASNPVFGTAGNSLYFYQDWELRPNPDWEQLVLNVPPGTFIDQVVIDTISTPEPSTIALGLIGLLALGRVARRRHVG